VSVNVHIAIGLSFILMAVYAIVNGNGNYIDGYNSSVMLLSFLGTYIVTLVFLMVRRRLIGGELGGNKRVWKIVSVAFITLNWVLFVGINGFMLSNN